jgi:hypothetical protein
LSEERIAELFDPPTEQREFVRHFTLSAADLAAIQRCRGDANRLGYALMLCYLRHPGRALRAGERPPVALLAFVAEQISVLPEAIDEYLASERNRQRHAVECQEQLGLRPFGRHAAAELANSLLPHAIENDQLAHLAELVMEECRQRRIIVPQPRRLERLCIELRYRARREVYRRLTDGLSADQRRRLDALMQHREETGQSWLAWLRQMPESAKPAAMLGLIERLGEIRDRTYENQQHRGSGLNLLVTAIILWNTRYLEHAVTALRRVEDVPDHLLAHLSPLGWERVNLTGDYVWAAAEQMTENPDGLRLLRTPPMIYRRDA